jgi:hypothetical protein
MNGNIYHKPCDFCNGTGLGFKIQELPTSKLCICSNCKLNVTIKKLNTLLKNFGKLTYNLTIKEITDDRYIHKPTNGTIQTANSSIKCISNNSKDYFFEHRSANC